MRTSFCRYLNARKFQQELRKTGAFGTSLVGEHLLETLDRLDLVRPRVRLRWPDPVARRFWAEQHEMANEMNSPLESDGDRWESAVELMNALDDFNFRYAVSGRIVHPFDKMKPDWNQFVEQPTASNFQSHYSRRVSIANEKYPELYDNQNVIEYYSSWQLLLATEVADLEVRIRLPLDQFSALATLLEKVRRSDIGSSPSISLPIPSLRESWSLLRHAPVLDAIVWSVEEAAFAWSQILAKRPNMNDELIQQEIDLYEQRSVAAAQEGCEKFEVRAENILESRCLAWDSEGRALCSQLYKEFLAAGINLMQRSYGWDFQKIRAQVGYQYSGMKPALEVIWPDEKVEATELLLSTLQNAELSEAKLRMFAQFLFDRSQESIFLYLKSFQDHAFRSAGLQIPSMHSGLQGLSVAIEHAVREMGGKGRQLYQMFENIWDGTDVGAKLKQHRKLLTQRLPPEQILTEVEDLRVKGTAERDAADLILAARMRGAVHYPLEERNHKTLHTLFFRVLRAAAITYDHVLGKNRQGKCLGRYTGLASFYSDRASSQPSIQKFPSSLSLP